MEFFASLAVGAFSFVWFGVVVGLDPELACFLGLVMAALVASAFALGA